MRFPSIPDIVAFCIQMSTRPSTAVGMGLNASAGLIQAVYDDTARAVNEVEAIFTSTRDVFLTRIGFQMQRASGSCHMEGDEHRKR